MLAVGSQLRVLYRSSSSGLDWPKSIREGSGLKPEPSESFGAGAGSPGTDAAVFGSKLKLASGDCFASEGASNSAGVGRFSEVVVVSVGNECATGSVLVSVGGWTGESSDSVTDDASSVVTATIGSSDTGTDSADFTSASGTAALWAEPGPEASQTTADSGFGTGADSLAPGSWGTELSSDDPAALLHCPAAYTFLPVTFNTVIAWAG